MGDENAMTLAKNTNDVRVSQEGPRRAERCNGQTCHGRKISTTEMDEGQDPLII